MRPIVSVIMPSYNHAKFLKEAIESVLNQTFENFELIIVDDYSTDNSREIIEQYVNEDKRIKAIFHSRNFGVARSMNDGFRVARGRYISSIASDDVWKENKLETELKYINSLDKKNIIVWSDMDIINEKNIPSGKTFLAFHNAQDRKKTGWLFEELVLGNFMSNSFMIPKYCIGNIRYDEKLKYLNDWKFFLDLSSRCYFYFIPEILAYYRIHGSNTIFTKKDKMKNERILVLEYVLKKYGDVISCLIRSRLHFQLASYYAEIGDTKMVKYNIRLGFRIFPVNILDLVKIGVILMFNKENILLRKFLKKIYIKILR